MPQNRDRRRMKRIAWESWITVKDADSGQMHNGMLYNFNSEGFYFECDAPFKSGSELSVIIESLPDARRSEVFQAKVRWAEEIVAPVVMYHYGVGAKCSKLTSPPGSKKQLKVISGGVETA